MGIIPILENSFKFNKLMTVSNSRPAISQRLGREEQPRFAHRFDAGSGIRSAYSMVIVDMFSLRFRTREDQAHETTRDRRARGGPDAICVGTCRQYVDRFQAKAEFFRAARSYKFPYLRYTDSSRYRESLKDFSSQADAEEAIVQFKKIGLFRQASAHE
jgi:hypothetical protein